MRNASIGRLAAIFLIVLGCGSSPSLAHKHKPHAAKTAAVTPEATGTEAPTEVERAPVTQHEAMGEMMNAAQDDRPPQSTLERLLDWIGRLHPVIVHFPIAFFPAALFTAVVGRRRPAFGKPVQFLVVAGGAIAPVAAVLGWLDAIGADQDPLLTVHRWLGTAVGAGGLALAIWAVRRPDQDRSPAMIAALAVITAAIVVQGWYGGALVHGIDHMNW
jgi:uncharacterized membrane protein